MPTELPRRSPKSRFWKSCPSWNRQRRRTAKTSSGSLPARSFPHIDKSIAYRFPDPEKISPPLLQLNEASFGYAPGKQILRNVNIDVGLDSRITIIGSNGSGKSTL